LIISENENVIYIDGIGKVEEISQNILQKLEG